MADLKKTVEEAGMSNVRISKRRSRPRWMLWVVALTPLVGASLFGAGAAHGYTNINLWIAETASTQAGGHPDIGIHAGYDTRILNNGGEPPGEPCNACQDPRDIVTHLPTGFIGSPSQIPQCSLADFATEKCSTDTQVGLFMLYLLRSSKAKSTTAIPTRKGSSPRSTTCLLTPMRRRSSGLLRRSSNSPDRSASTLAPRATTGSMRPRSTSST